MPYMVIVIMVAESSLVSPDFADFSAILRGDENSTCLLCGVCSMSVHATGKQF